jgi:ketosteroid isomerase-like protein
MGEALEIVRRQHDAFQREDWEAFFALYDPEVEIDLSRSGIPGGSIHHGHEGIREGGSHGVERGSTMATRSRS